MCRYRSAGATPIAVSGLMRQVNLTSTAKPLCSASAQAASWPLKFAQGMCAALLLPWAALSAAREALECYTYQAYYMRERRREAWELEHFPEGEVRSHRSPKLPPSLQMNPLGCGASRGTCIVFM